MGSDSERASFVGGGDEPEEQLGPVVVERSEPDLVDQDQVGFEDRLDDPADGVVGEAAVEGLDEVGGGEVPDAVSGIDCGVAEGDEEVALASPGGAEGSSSSDEPPPSSALSAA